MRKQAITFLIILAFALCMAACGEQEPATPEETTKAAPEIEVEVETDMKMFIANEEVQVDWEYGEAVVALLEEAQKQPIKIDMSMYDDFEQVGELGMSLPADDEQIETEPGDIMLYSGDKIVVFYGSNTWDYTRLGKITDKTPEELAKMLGNGDVTITIQGE